MCCHGDGDYSDGVIQSVASGESMCSMQIL